MSMHISKISSSVREIPSNEKNANVRSKKINHSYHPSSPSVGATDTTLGVGDATRLAAVTADQSYFPAANANTDLRGVAGPFLLLGACIESYTDVCGGVSARRPFTLAVGVAARLGYTVLVLVRESGRGGDEDATAAAAAVFKFLGRAAGWAAAARACASSTATWSRSLFSRSYIVATLSFLSSLP